MGLTGIWGSSSTEEFWNQLRTFGWQPVKAYVVAHELKRGDRVVDGKVTVVYNFKGVDKLGSDVIWRKFSWADRAKKMDTLVQSFEPGKEVTIYVSNNAESVSLGRFPNDYVFWNGIRRVVVLPLMTLAFFWGLWRRIQAEKSKHQESAS